MGCPIASPCGVAEYPFRSMIPTHNHAIEIFTDDGIVERGDNSGGLRVLTCTMVFSKQGVAQNLQQLAIHNQPALWHRLLLARNFPQTFELDTGMARQMLNF
jgi:hypothetical protein